jgi:hypothetical protein
MKAIIKVTLTILVISLFTSGVNAQTWPKFYFYEGASKSSSECAEETYDKGFALLSKLGGFPYPVEAGWLIKTDINGEILWTRTLGNKEYYYTSCNSLKATSDSGIIISMNTGYLENSPFGGTKNAVFMKLNSCGQVDWCKIFDMPDIQNNAGFISKTTDGYIGLLRIEGRPNTLVKFNFNGQIEWIFDYNHPDLENVSLNDLVVLADSSLLVSGYGEYTISQYEIHYKPIKLNIRPNGDIINFQILYLENNTIEGAIDNQTIVSTSGRLFSAGTTFLSQQSMRKHSLNDLNPVNYCFGNMEESYSLCWAENNMIAISGSSTDMNWQGIFNVSVVDTMGIQLINRVLSNNTNNGCRLKLSKTFDNKILATGPNNVSSFNYNSNTFLFKLTSTLEDDVYDSSPRVYDYACPGGVVQNDTLGMEECDMVVSAEHLATLPDIAVMEVYPNPVNDQFQVRLPEFIALRNSNKGLSTALYQSNYQQQSRLQVFDLSGMFVTEQKLTQGQLLAEFDASNWAPGMYLLRLVYKDKTVGSAKVVK